MLVIVIGRKNIIIIFLRIEWSFNCKNLCVLHTRTKLGWNWSFGSRWEHFKFCQCIFAILLLSPLGKWCDPSFERNWIPFTKASFVSSLLKLAQWFWRRFDKFLTWNVFLLQCITLLNPLRKGCAWPFIWTNLNSLDHRHHHYQWTRWRALNFDLYPTLMAIEQWGVWNWPQNSWDWTW